MQRFFIASILLILSYGGHAVEVENLYQASAPVSSRDEQERLELMPQLLQKVMLKVVGNQALLESAELEPVLMKAEQFMRQYEYERTNIVGADLTEPDELSLSLQFDSTAVNRALNELQLPIWGKSRPGVLIWAVIDNNNGASILGLESPPEGVLRPLIQAADQRGLPILIPLMDWLDQSVLSVTDILEANEAAIDAASERYAADIVMSAIMQVNGEELTVQWQLKSAAVTERWQSQGNMEEAFATGIGHLADRLALQYGQLVDNTGEVQRLTVQVKNVESYADFSRLMAYLEKIEFINDIRIISLGEQQLELAIAFRGSIDVLQSTFDIDKLLIQDFQFQSNSAKQYRLAP